MRMEQVVDRPTAPAPSLILDRPGWIPPHITQNWDANPYAYQTEEELMPAGGPHGQLLSDILEVLRPAVAARDRMLLLDTFLLYRDVNQIKQRIGPDLMLVPHQDPPPSAYDLDVEPEPPAMIIEVTSPKSRLPDLEDKRHFYIGDLGVATYIVVDGLTARGEVKEQIDLYVWRNVNGHVREVRANAAGRFVLPELGLWITALGRRICFGDAATNAMFPDMAQQKAAREAAEARIEQERQRAEAAEARAEQERQRAERQAAKLRELGIDPDHLA
jgi:Uma2 family endonuclease